MYTAQDWVADFVDVPSSQGVALEGFTDTNIHQGPGGPPRPSSFKPINIIMDQGRYHANIYVCQAEDGSDTSQQLAIWLGSLKSTDYVVLTVSSLTLDVQLPALIGVLAALASTPATVEIKLDSIVNDGLGYFYLLASRVTKGSMGALFIPSYVLQREVDTSQTWKAVHDFYKWIVEQAVAKGRLTSEEADALNSGSHVVIPDNRF